MNLYTAIVNLPNSSHNKHAVIDKEMKELQNKIIIITDMYEDTDYDYKSYHKKTKKLWWWNK